MSGQRNFFAALQEDVELLEACANLVGRIVAQGGEVHLKIDLPGDANMGALLTAATMRRLGLLGVDLDVEVFPEMA